MKRLRTECERGVLDLAAVSVSVYALQIPSILSFLIPQCTLHAASCIHQETLIYFLNLLINYACHLFGTCSHMQTAHCIFQTLKLWHCHSTSLISMRFSFNAILHRRCCWCVFFSHYCWRYAQFSVVVIEKTLCATITTPLCVRTQQLWKSHLASPAQLFLWLFSSIF